MKGRASSTATSNYEGLKCSVGMNLQVFISRIHISGVDRKRVGKGRFVVSKGDSRVDQDLFVVWQRINSGVVTRLHRVSQRRNFRSRKAYYRSGWNHYSVVTTDTHSYPNISRTSESDADSVGSIGVGIIAIQTIFKRIFCQHTTKRYLSKVVYRDCCGC